MISMGFWFFFTFLAVFSERVVSIDGPNPAPDIVTIVSFPPPPPPPPNDSFYLFLLFNLIYFFSFVLSFGIGETISTSTSGF